MNIKIKKILGDKAYEPCRLLFSVFCITGFVLCILSPVSCKMTEEGIELFAKDTDAPVIEYVTAVSSNVLKIGFSEPVILVDPKIGLCNESGEIIDSKEISSIVYDDMKKNLEITFPEKTDVGKTYALSGIVSDIRANTLQFCQKFYGYNDNPARLVLSEVRVQQSKPNVEFVEFYVLKGGNTFGLELVSAANEKRNYMFPAMEVQDGEYITFHGRTVESEAEQCINEFGDKLDASEGADSHPSARDLWREGDEKIVSQIDVILLRNNLKNRVEDALLLCKSDKAEWSSKIDKYAKQAFESNVWFEGSGVGNAVVSDKLTTIHRTASRTNIPELKQLYPKNSRIPDVIRASSSDWIITEKKGSGKTAVSGATPGYENTNYTGE